MHEQKTFLKSLSLYFRPTTLAAICIDLQEYQTQAEAGADFAIEVFGIPAIPPENFKTLFAVFYETLAVNCGEEEADEMITEARY